LPGIRREPGRGNFENAGGVRIWIEIISRKMSLVFYRHPDAPHRVSWEKIQVEKIQVDLGRRRFFNFAYIADISLMRSLSCPFQAL